MNNEIKYVIDIINELDDPRHRFMVLPDDNLIDTYEQVIGYSFPNDYRDILKNVSNAFVGSLSLLTLNQEMGGVYGELKSTIEDARSIGLPINWLPICEDNGDYYCITPDNHVRFWNHNGPSSEIWPDLATWIKEVWLGEK